MQEEKAPGKRAIVRKPRVLEILGISSAIFKAIKFWVNEGASFEIIKWGCPNIKNPLPLKQITPTQLLLSP